MSWLSRFFKKRPDDTVSLNEPISDDITLGDYLKAQETRLKAVEQGFWRIDKRLQRAGIIPPETNGDTPEAEKVEGPAAAGPRTSRIPQEGEDISSMAEYISQLEGGE